MSGHDSCRSFPFEGAGIGKIKHLKKLKQGASYDRQINGTPWGQMTVVSEIGGACDILAVSNGKEGAPRFFVKRVRNEEHGVAKLLCFEAAPFKPPKSPVVGIRLKHGLVHAHGGLVCRGIHDEPVHGLDRPIGFDKFCRKPIKQFRMERQFAQVAEVVHGANNAFAEMSLPNAVDHDPCRQGVIGLRDPLGKLQTTTLILGKGAHSAKANRGWKSPWGRFAKA